MNGDFLQKCKFSSQKGNFYSVFRDSPVSCYFLKNTAQDTCAKETYLGVANPPHHKQVTKYAKHMPPKPPSLIYYNIKSRSGCGHLSINVQLP